MVQRSVLRLSIATLCAVGLALGCASTPEEDSTIGGGSSWGEPSDGSSGGSRSGGAIRGGTTGGAVVGPQDAETAALQRKLDAVYFDYDRSTLRADSATRLKGHATTIRTFPEWAYVTVQGHCDERGTEEYNLALGDRRADAVKRYLTTLGVAADRIRTVSYGELQAASPGHDETAWKENRRAEFQVSR